MGDVKYVVVSNIVIDDVVLADGSCQQGILGGAATYAAAGARFWSEGVGIVSGIGQDFEALCGDWFHRNHIDVAGLHVRAENTPRTWVVYHANGEREETPQFGYKHFQLMEPMPGDIPGQFLAAQGFYVFRDDRLDFWQEMLALHAQHPFILLWEIAANVTIASHWDQIADILGKVDILSINRTEANHLCQTSTPERAIERLLATGVKAVALRLGDDGSLVANRQATWHIPAVKAEVVDVTGAGNAYSGGFLVGYCSSGGDLATAGKWGTVSAALMLGQYGPPAIIDPANARQISTLVSALKR